MYQKYNSNRSDELKNSGWAFSHEAKEPKCPMCNANRFSQVFTKRTEYKTLYWTMCEHVE